jgi:T5SS/PEP-CTERM-associated repeat protein
MNDHARFTLGGTYTITFGVPVTNQQLSVTLGAVTFDLNTRTYSLTTNSAAATIGANAPLQTARLTIQNGTLDVNDNADVIRVGSPTSASVGFLTITTGGRVGDGVTNPAIRMGDFGPGVLTVESDGQLNASSIQIGELNPSTATVTGPLAAMTVNGLTQVSADVAGSLLTVELGAEVTTGSMKLGDLAPESGAALVTGENSTVSITSELIVGAAGRGALSVESGGAMTSGQAAFIGQIGGSHGDVTVTGAGSTLSINGDLNVAGNSTSAGGTGMLTIDNGASVTLTGTGTFRLWPDATVNFDGGTLNAAASDFRGGQVNFAAGTIRFTGAKSFVSTELTTLLGPGKTLLPGQTLSVAGAATLTAPLFLDGGTFSVGSLANQGTLTLRSGNFNVTGAGGMNLRTAGFPTLVVPLGLVVDVNSNLTIASGNHLVVPGGTILAGSITNSAGGRITLDGATARLEATAPLGPSLANSGILTGRGIVAANLSNNAGGEIRPSAGESLLFTGTTHSNSGEINLAGGSIEFIGGLTNNAGAMIAGRGSIHTGGLANLGVIATSGGFTDVYGDVTNGVNGLVTSGGGGVLTFYDDVTNDAEIRTNASSRTVIFGAVTGAGSFPGTGVVEQLGDTRPGNSPAIIDYGGDLVFGDTSRLFIEIGGATAGTQFDQLVVAGDTTLDGTLDLSTINGFSPTLPGQSFVIMNYGSHTGAFDAIVGQPAESVPGLYWAVQYTTTQTILTTSALPGDIDLDGDVDRIDAVLFTPHLGAADSIWTTGDFDGDQLTTLDDLFLLQANLGQTLPSPVAQTAIPEPSSLACLLAILFVAMRAPSARKVNRR